MRTGEGNERVRVALDAMGGDFAPQETVRGAVLAAQANPDDLEVVLVGVPPLLDHELAKYDAITLPIRVVEATDVIPDGSHAAFAMHRRTLSSVAVATQLVRDGKADAVVGMGHTGACLVAATWYLGRMAGIERPAVGSTLAIAPQTFVVDIGTNPDATPRQLLQFAILGTVYARLMMGISDPTVALLSNGAEEGKGTKQVRATHDLLKRSGLRFVGNVEGMDVVEGTANVVVCDGFVGNVMVKFLEGLSTTLLGRLETLVGADGGVGLAQFRAELSNMTDVTMSSHGLLFLGVNGIFVPGHGRAQAPAVQRAIESAKLAVQRDFVAKLCEELESVRATLSA